jgi:hypothetical protein
VRRAIEGYLDCGLLCAASPESLVGQEAGSELRSPSAGIEWSTRPPAACDKLLRRAVAAENPMRCPSHYRRIGMGALFVVAAATRPGRAEAGHLQLTFHAPPECGSAAQVQDAIATMVKREGPRLTAAIKIARVGDRYVAVVRTEPAAERSLAASDCRAVVEAASVVLALAIDPNARLAAAAHADAKPPAARPAVSNRPQPTIAAAIALDTSTLPRTAIGAILGGGFAWPHWSAWLKFSAWDPQDAVLVLSPTRGGHFTWWMVAVSVCSAPLRVTWAALCLSPEVGRLGGTGIGEGLSRRLTASAVWFGVGAGPALEWRFAAHWAVRGEASAVLTVLGRHPFIVESSDSTATVHQAARISGRAHFGLATRF